MYPLQMAFLSWADWLQTCFRAPCLEVFRKRMSSIAILSRSQMQGRCTLSTPCTPHSLFFTWEDPLWDILVLPELRYPDVFTLEGRMWLRGGAAPGVVLQYAPCAVRVHHSRAPLPPAQARQCGCNTGNWPSHVNVHGPGTFAPDTSLSQGMSSLCHLSVIWFFHGGEKDLLQLCTDLLLSLCYQLHWKADGLLAWTRKVTV